MDLPIQRGDLLLGKYLIGETLGAGGMGVVVAAEHIQLGQKVAVKFLPATLRQNPDRVARFVREARAAARIRSEHVARVVDVSGPDSDICYMVMEYLDGSDLAHVIRARGRLPPDEAVGYVLQACEAIAEAHGAGVVHRDLKPSNLFLTRRRDGTPLIKVLDFGISKVASMTTDDGPVTDLTSTMAVMGSPVYMSPEQVRSSKAVDARTDVWSLGVILHELLTGKPVFVSESATELLAMIVADPPTPLRRIVPGLPATLESTVLACLEKQPAERLPDVATLARRLQPLAPRWAMASVERILGGAATSGPTVGPRASITTAPVGVAAVDGETAPLAPGSTTSAQLSGELVSVGDLRRRSKGAPEDTARVAPSPTATQPLRRRRGLMAGAVIGGVIAVGAAALVLVLGRAPQSPHNGEGGTQPPADVPSVRSLEKTARAPEPDPSRAPGLADPSRGSAPVTVPAGDATADQAGVKVRDMSPEELAAADAKIAARLIAEKTTKQAPKQPKAVKPRVGDAPRNRKPAPSTPGETAVVAHEPASSVRPGKPPAPSIAPHIEAKDPLDGRF